ncbi:MAG: peptidylprolyl isomerase [Alphaproteobacteria bacterium]
MPSQFVRPLASLACVAAAALCLTSGSMPVSQAQAAENTLRAAAVVNDIVISSYDLDQRVKLYMVTSGGQQNPEMAKRMRPQILRQLVDELLQLQEAQDSKVQVTSEDLEKSLKRIAQQSNVTVETIYKTLDDNNIARSTLLTQIRADIAWQRLVQGRLAPRVTVSDEEIDAAYLQALEASKQTQYLLSEIFLAVDVPSAEEQVRQNAQSILGQLRQGANFPALARQFSQSSTASSGGDLGWMIIGDLPAGVSDTVKGMGTGTVSEPVRAAGGFYLIALRQKRLAAGSAPQKAAAPPPAQVAQPEQKMKPVVTLGRISLPIAGTPSKAKEEQIRTASIDIFRSVNGCVSAGQVAKARGATFQMVGAVTVRDLAPQFADILRKTPNGRATPPLRGAKGVELYVICEGGMRPAVSAGGSPDEMGEKPAAEVTKEEIENRLFNQELSMLSRRYLRDLRRDATIEIKEN